MTTSDYKTRSYEEAKTYELFSEALRGNKWNPLRVGISRAFKAMYASALTAEDIHRVACAVLSTDFDFEAFKKELTKLSREKVLRSYAEQGKRLYEVNY